MLHCFCLLSNLNWKNSVRFCEKIHLEENIERNSIKIKLGAGLFKPSHFDLGWWEKTNLNVYFDTLWFFKRFYQGL